MKVEFSKDGQTLTAKIVGEIDHHNAKYIREKIDFEVNTKYPKVLILDFNLVTFMDSSGIGIIMGRYAIISKMNASLEIINVNANIYKIMQLAKLSAIANIKKRGEY